ncbi:GNAT family N-acetyltransferase [Bacillus sp. H-16]|nr:GNAT family N-acetyltransferase [Alteribacter salitolerans]
MEYKTDLEGITEEMLDGFFVGWPDAPSKGTHLRLLESSDKRVVALERERGVAVGFITAVSDGVLSAYIPFLEVLPDYQGRGIGETLVKKMVEELDGLYMIDLMCDPELQPYYERLGMQRSHGMVVRNYQNQSGR